MALTPSNMLPLGTEAPAFSLPDTVSGNIIHLNNIKSDKATVVMFICNHCPYVLHVNEQIVAISNEFIGKGVTFVGISSNDVKNYPDDAPDKMKVHAEANGYPFPYLYDESQNVARAYDAACTPDFYVFDKGLKLKYRGRMDGSTPGNNIENNGEDLRAAIEAVMNEEEVFQNQLPSMGCNIKWK